MMAAAYPVPNANQRAKVTLNDVPLWFVPGSYSVDEAPRFGEKISTGSLRYADFNPYESAHGQETFGGGYGLRRFSDVTSKIADAVSSNVYYETDNVDCSIGPAILGPLVNSEGLVGNTSISIQFIAEYTPTGGTYAGQTILIALGAASAGVQGIWVRNTAGNWTLVGPVLPGLLFKGAITIFGGYLVIGFEGGAPAVWTNDLASFTNVKDSQGNDLYAYALTSDRSAIYLAGGKVATTTNQVLSSTDPTKFISTPTVCGGADNRITTLAPGGGVEIVFVGTVKELGAIDNGGIYRTLIPYDSSLYSNSRGMRWWAAKGGDEQRGPIVLAVPRDRSLWIYEPSTDTSGRARDISPWANFGYRPQTIRGATRAIQGSARWLYYAIRGSNQSWVLRYDQSGGGTHPIIHLTDLGWGTLCDYLYITTLFNNLPRLFGSYGSRVFSVVLPLDGENPLDDATYEYNRTGSLTIPDVDLGFPDEIKILYTVRVVADNLTPLSRTIDVYASLDGGSYTLLGRVENSPSGQVSFPVGTTCKRVGLKFVLTTDDNFETPILLGYSLRCSINSKLYRLWSFRAMLPFSADNMGGEDLYNPIDTINDLWDARRDGTIVPFIDRFGASRDVRILHLKEHDNAEDSEPLRVPGTLLDVVLLEVADSPGDFDYDDALSTYDTDGILYG